MHHFLKTTAYLLFHTLCVMNIIEIKRFTMKFLDRKTENEMMLKWDTLYIDSYVGDYIL